MYLLPCPECDQSVPVSPSQAGDSTTCPGCSIELQIPKLGDLRKLPQQDDGRGEDRGGRSEGGGDFQILTVLLGMVALIGLVVAGFAGIQWALIDVPTTTDEHVAHLKRQYSDLEPARFVRELENIEDHPLEAPNLFNYKVLERKKNRWMTNALVAGGISVVSLLAAIALAASGRTPKTE